VFFFPAFDKSYSKAGLLVIFMFQVVLEYVVSNMFLSSWKHARDLCVSASDAKRLNALLLKHGMAQCRCRFGVFALVLLAYIHFANVKCAGYTPSMPPGCRANDTGGVCIELVFSVASCFYHTAAASQLIFLSRHEPIDRRAMALLKCTTIGLLSAALIYSVVTSVDLAVQQSGSNGGQATHTHTQ